MTTSPQAQEQAAHQLSQAIGRHMSKPIQQTQAMLADAKNVGVVCHVHPDADAVGAAAAMVMALRQRGLWAVASYGNNELPAKSLLTIPGWDAFVPFTELDEDIDTWVTVDCASPGRLGALEQRLMASDRLINVDHHPTNTRFGAVDLVDEYSESTTMVLLDFFGVWGIKLTREMAHALYAGLLTDTASFQFGRSRMHTAAARLLDKGLDPRTIGAQLLEEHPFAYLPFLGTVLATATEVKSFGGGVGLIHVTIAHEDQRDVGQDETESVIDIVRTTNAADVCAVLKEYSPGVWSVSLRSREVVDVSQVALSLGGGGHLRAAGVTLEGTRDEVLEALLGASDVAASTASPDTRR
nr:DHH family phosphoesterase [Corynebacterium lactis]